ncbi:GntR family transcriptional regulator [Peptoniphilus sp. AGMB00490]|uniref:GntR family transcriptional regulator n=1 Tax=Peptoniphilus faecalis TaxID=2731255 RepID=A0A848REF9_9FIRM|nr:GntR family transcriptional regulator [Peptoniphilus faecalis]NMW84405.1 GntR family transcriptional regulator [Peptoniphilus faecalis]
MEKSEVKNYKIKNKKTLNQQVYESLKQMLLDNIFEVGQKLNETDIAEALGVSATPVRETFRRLATEGFLEVIPYKGVYVKEFSEKELIEVYECRQALEKLALELAISNISEDEIDNLIEEIEENTKINDIDSNVEMSNKLHNFIVEKSGNKRLKELIGNLNDVLIRDRNISAGDKIRRKEILEEHLNILNALKEKNLEQAKKYLQDHIKRGCYYIINKKKIN